MLTGRPSGLRTQPKIYNYLSSFSRDFAWSIEPSAVLSNFLLQLPLIARYTNPPLIQSITALSSLSKLTLLIFVVRTYWSWHHSYYVQLIGYPTTNIEQNSLRI